MNKELMVMALAASLFGVCFAQTKPAEANGKRSANGDSQQSKKEQEAFAKFSMDMLQGDHIDPSFKPLSIAKIVEAIEKLPPGIKGETETTADFNARMAVARAAKFLGDSTLDDTFAFVLPVTKLETHAMGMVYQYDADASELRLFALPNDHALSGLGGPRLGKTPYNVSHTDQFQASSITEALGEYKASNVFGVKAKVKKHRTTIFGLAPNKIPFLKFDRKYVYIKPVHAALVKMDSAKAAKELGQLKALVIMKLASPYIRYDESIHTPTIATPVDSLVLKKYLLGHVAGIVYYSGITGEILARVPAAVDSPAAPNPSGGHSPAQVTSRHASAGPPAPSGQRTNGDEVAVNTTLLER